MPVEFEQLIEESWRSSKASWPDHFDSLVASLSDRPKDELIEAYKFLFERRTHLFKPQLYCATFLLCEGYFSESNFMSFIEAVTGLPQRFYDLIIRDPDSISDLEFMSGLKWDDFPSLSIPSAAYDKKLGNPSGTRALDPFIPELEFDTDRHWGPLEGCITIPNLQAWLPKLFDEYGEEAIESTSLGDT